MIDWEEWTGMLLSSVRRSATTNLLNVLHASLPSVSLFPVPSTGVNLVNGLSYWVTFPSGLALVFTLLSSSLLICTDVALKMHFPFLERPPTHRQAPPEKTTTFLDVDLFWYGASAILKKNSSRSQNYTIGSSLEFVGDVWLIEKNCSSTKWKQTKQYVSQEMITLLRRIFKTCCIGFLLDTRRHTDAEAVGQLG